MPSRAKPGFLRSTAQFPTREARANTRQARKLMDLREHQKLKTTHHRHDVLSTLVLYRGVYYYYCTPISSIHNMSAVNTKPGPALSKDIASVLFSSSQRYI